MKLRNLLKSIFVIMLLFIITGCNEPSVVDIKLSEDNIKQDINDFNISDITLTVTYDDNTVNIVNVTKDMVSIEDLDKLNKIGMHDIKINYLDKVITLNINLTNYYEVTFILDGETIDTQTVEHGMDAILPNESTTNKEGYTILGWNHDGKNITEDTTIDCIYEINKYEVIFTVGSEFKKTIIVEHGKDVIPPEPYIKEGYTFIGWNHDCKTITEDTIIEGIYELMKFRVEFYYDGELIDTQIVEYGSYATPPELKVKEWHRFLEWYWIDSPITFNENMYAKVEYVEGGELLEYKYDTKTEIKEYLKVSKEILTIDERTLIDSYINDGCNKIDNSTNEEEVDKIAIYTKQLIEHVGAKYYEDTFERMPGEEVYTEGNGTYENPYIIDTKGKLIYLSNNTNNGIGCLSHYELKADIDLEGIEWMPIDYFCGHFNGNGYEISNYKITKISKLKRYLRDYGLFGYNTGTIENLGVKNFYIDLEFPYENSKIDISVGGIVGRNEGPYELAADNEGVIQNCYSFGTINLIYNGKLVRGYLPTKIYAGGIAGSNRYEAIVQNCYSVVNIDVSFYKDEGNVYISGVSNECDYSDIKNCFEIISYTKTYEKYTKQSIRGDDIGENSFYYDDNKENTYNVCRTEDLNSIEFYTDILGWSEETWDLTNIEFKDGAFLEDRYPKLKRK